VQIKNKKIKKKRFESDVLLDQLVSAKQLGTLLMGAQNERWWPAVPEVSRVLLISPRKTGS
jgi:hypothetical protein